MVPDGNARVVMAAGKGEWIEAHPKACSPQSGRAPVKLPTSGVTSPPNAPEHC